MEQTVYLHRIKHVEKQTKTPLEVFTDLLQAAGIEYTVGIPDNNDIVRVKYDADPYVQSHLISVLANKISWNL